MAVSPTPCGSKGVSDAVEHVVLWKEGEGEGLVVAWKVSCGADFEGVV